MATKHYLTADFFTETAPKYRDPPTAYNMKSTVAIAFTILLVCCLQIKECTTAPNATSSATTGNDTIATTPKTTSLDNGSARTSTAPLTFIAITGVVAARLFAK
ncbi:uncharacterized protein LOC127842815 [Dreissena polymorpha]|uniref:Uncharacterized protein n=1 Tax=Dreissena polymorpha TaxID=45954 RepID=A0A9D4F2S4_DREPO|nr:uncharacterized protein LOC127842815 [Dreissena polymorpha]KAH3790306.1 hypothetical protein DPMN_168504 [Dreissena polymorpha]